MRNPFDSLEALDENGLSKDVQGAFVDLSHDQDSKDFFSSFSREKLWAKMAEVEGKEELAEQASTFVRKVFRHWWTIRPKIKTVFPFPICQCGIHFSKLKQKFSKT